MKNHIKGFTLVELLVVIAIIGLLSSIVFASLGTPRKKARVANVQAGLRSALTIVSLCINEGGTVQVGAGDKPISGDSICSGGEVASAANKWPTLPTANWVYEAMTNKTLDTFSFSAADASSDKTRVTCTAAGCSKTDL